MKNIVYLAGLPRSGSTVLSNILGMHKDIYATPSSPLCSVVQEMRRHWSDDPFLLSQIDDNFDIVNKRLKRSTMSFIQSWSNDNDKSMVVDKNRGWLFCVEWLRELDPKFKIIVTLRDLRSIYSSIESRHRDTLFLDFPDHMEHNSVDARANSLFADNGLVGSNLKAIQNLKDIPNILSHVYYWRFEDFIANPKNTINHLFRFPEVEPFDIDFNNIIQSTHESDSYYRMKYPHGINKSISKPKDFNDVPLSPRILTEIINRFRWYYEEFYMTKPISQADNKTEDDSIIIRNLEDSIRTELISLQKPKE